MWKAFRGFFFLIRLILHLYYNIITGILHYLQHYVCSLFNKINYQEVVIDFFPAFSEAEVSRQQNYISSVELSNMQEADL